MQVPRKRQTSELLKGIQQNDLLYFDFESDFLLLINHIIIEYYPDFLINNCEQEELKHFAIDIFNLVEDIIHKDNIYSTADFNKELNKIQRLTKAEKRGKQCPQFIEDISKNVKQLAVEYFNDIYHLSGDGFRLLEQYANYKVYRFSAWVCKHVD